MKIYKVWAKEVAKELLKPNKQRIEAISEEIAKIITNSVKATMPDPLKEAYEKYPSAIACVNYRYAKDSRATVMIHFRPPCPDPTKFGTSMEQAVALSKQNDRVRNLEQELVSLTIETRKLEKSIACTVESIGTSSKLKVEFPEAYGVFEDLQEKRKQHRQPVQTTNCDAVEKLRAELSKGKRVDQPGL